MTKMLLPILFSTTVLVIVVAFVHIIDKQYAAPGAEPTLSAPGPRLVLLLVDRMQQSDNRASQTSDSKKGPLWGVRVHLEAPANMHAPIQTLLRSTDAVWTNAAQAQLVLHWKEGQWALSGRDAGDTVLAWPAIYQALNPPDEVTTHWAQVWRPTEARANGEASDKNFRSLLLAAIVPVALLMPLIFILTSICTSMCFDIDRARSSGLLESFALAPMPFWTFLLPLAMAKATWATLGAAGLLLVASLFLPAVSLVTLMCLATSMFFICTTLGLLGCLQVLFFHHRHSRLIGGFVLNPIALALPLMTVSIPAIGYLFEALGKPENINDLPIVGMPALQALITLGVVGVVATFATAVLCWAVEKRLGARRTGLAVV